MNFCDGRQMGFTDVCQMDYEAQFNHFTDFLQWLKAVSYTHLDVYKRQVLMQVKKSKLELEGEGTVDIINVKCEPDMVGVYLLYTSRCV